MLNGINTIITDFNESRHIDGKKIKTIAEEIISTDLETLSSNSDFLMFYDDLHELYESEEILKYTSLVALYQIIQKKIDGKNDFEKELETIDLNASASAPVPKELVDILLPLFELLDSYNDELNPEAAKLLKKFFMREIEKEEKEKRKIHNTKNFKNDYIKNIDNNIKNIEKYNKYKDW